MHKTALKVIVYFPCIKNVTVLKVFSLMKTVRKITLLVFLNALVNESSSIRVDNILNCLSYRLSI